MTLNLRNQFRFASKVLIEEKAPRSVVLSFFSNEGEYQNIQIDSCRNAGINSSSIEHLNAQVAQKKSTEHKLQQVKTEADHKY